MSVRKKKDEAAIRQCIDDLKRQAWLGPARAWWPGWLFRFDPIEAAVSILETGKLLSRQAAIQAGVHTHDSASPGVIAATSDRWKNYVRLYFRPLTPTQFTSEGVRPIGDICLGAHCPVPVVCLFDSVDLMTREEAEFSNGNLAASPETGHDASFLAKIPFKTVYHNSYFDPSERGTIVFHRHAEVIFPEELDLSGLRFIGCRSRAEYEMLLHLLSARTRKKWESKIGLGTKGNLHFRHWSFVEEVELTARKILIRFNPSSKTPGPFRARIEIRVPGTNQLFEWSDAAYQSNATLELDIRDVPHAGRYEVRLLLDGHLAYANDFVEAPNLI